MNKLIIMLVYVFLYGGYAAAANLNDFASDGCSLFPDGTLQDRTLWCNCCFNHDIAYWQGGSQQERKQADRIFRTCVFDRTGNKTLAAMMYKGVRAGGSPLLPTGYRWGYGWKYGRGYQALTAEEQKQVAAKLDKYRKVHPSGYCPRQ